MSQYQARVLTSEPEIAAIAAPWAAMRRGLDRPLVEQHPDWLPLVTPGDRGDRSALVIALYRGDELAGVVPFLLRPEKFACRLGYRPVAQFPMLVADLCGETLMVPDDPAAHECLLRALAGGGVDVGRPTPGSTPGSAATGQPFHMLFLESVSLDSPLGRLIESSSLLRERFHIYSPGEVTPHHWIQLAPTFEEYLAKFSGASRKKLRQGVRYLEDACQGDLTLHRFTDRDQVPELLGDVQELSRRCWQGTRLGQTVDATDTTREYLGTLADRGWLRAYLLKSGKEPLAFWLACQSDGVHWPWQIGFDPAWASLQPGKILMYRLLEDLHAWNAPEWVDFGFGDNAYKRFFATHNYEERSYYLIRKQPYTSLAFLAHRGCNTAGAAVRSALDRLHLREKVRRVLRGRESTPAAPSPAQSS